MGQARRRPGAGEHVSGKGQKLSRSLVNGAELFLSRFCDAPDVLRKVFVRVPGRTLRLRDGDIVCREGDDAEQLWLVQRGQIRIESDTLLVTRQEGDLIGEQAQYRNLTNTAVAPRGATMRALGDVELLPLDHAYIAQLSVEEQVVWHRTMARVLSAKLDQATANRTELRREARDVDELVRRFVCAEGLAASRASLSTGRIDPEQTNCVFWFSDIAGFSKFASGMPPAESARIIRKLMDMQAEAIEASEGQIDKFMGDGLMAFWRAPDQRRLRIAAQNSCRAAIASAERIREWCRTAGFPLDVRIGLHAGPVILGDFGGADRIAFTAIGETVNTASRYEQAHSEGRLGPVRVSPTVWAHVDDAALRSRFDDETAFSDKHGVEYRVRSLKA